MGAARQCNEGISTPEQFHRAIAMLTWVSSQGLYVCAYVDGIHTELSALIFEKEDMTQGYKGSIGLSKMYDARNQL